MHTVRDLCMRAVRDLCMRAVRDLCMRAVRDLCMRALRDLCMRALREAFGSMFGGRQTGVCLLYATYMIDCANIRSGMRMVASI